MTDVTDGFPTRDELLAGPRGGKHAGALVFLIEKRTAQAVGRSRHAVQRFTANPPSEDIDLGYFSAFAGAREAAPRATVQQLERHVDAWSELVPRNARMRAAVAHEMGARYELVHSAIPRIRAALGLDDVHVREAYETEYGVGLAELYAARVGLTQRLRWRAATTASWLENLPPFWTVFALALTETVGATILALPIALASIGPLAGLVVLVVIGALNVVTVAYMAEAVARSGPVRHGGAYLGRIVEDYLGPLAGSVLSAALLVVSILLLPAFYIGLGTTLAAATGVPAVVWVAAIFAVNVAFLRRGLAATVASALFVGAVNLALILALSLIAVTNVRAENLTHVNVPFLNGPPDVAMLGLVFGVAFAAYFGHTTTALCGRLVLGRDPTGRALVHGCVAAQATAIALYALFVVAVNGAVGHTELSNEPGTAIGPLTAIGGPAVAVLGSVFVVLGMGMVSIHFAFAVFKTVHERLPVAVSPTLALPLRTATLRLSERSWRLHPVTFSLSYVGARGAMARLRLHAATASGVYTETITLRNRWELDARTTWLPQRRRPVRLVVEVLQVRPEVLTVRVATSLRVSVHEVHSRGLPLAGVVAASDTGGSVLGYLVRHGAADVVTIARHVGAPTRVVEAEMRDLVAEGAVTHVGGQANNRYAVDLGHRRSRVAPDALWSALDIEPPTRVPAGEPSSVAHGGVNVTAAFFISAAPVALTFAATVWMLLAGSGSFTAILSFIGVIAVSLLAGVLPALLVSASRRKGTEATQATAGPWGRAGVAAAVGAVFFVNIMLHGLVVWDGLERFAAVAAAAAIAVLTVVFIRRGALARRLTVEVRADDRDRGKMRFRISMGTEEIVATVGLRGEQQARTVSAATGAVMAGVEQVTVSVDAAQLSDVREVAVWAHRITEEGTSLGMPAAATVRSGDVDVSVQLPARDGQAVVPIRCPAAEMVLDLSQPWP